MSRSSTSVIALSRRARRVVEANLLLAATFIAVLVTWYLAIGLNGLRLLRQSAWGTT